MSWDPVHDSRRAFLCCLRAQCAPGTAVGPLPRPGLAADPRVDAAAAVLLTLLDATTTVAAVGAPALDALPALLRATGAHPAEPSDADFVLVSGDPAESITRARRGDRHRPERGATVVVVPGPAREPVTLAGPGVDGRRTAAVALGPAARRARERANQAAPCGVDLLLVGPDGVLALPRSVSITEGAA